MPFYSLLNRGIDPEVLHIEISSSFQIPSFHIIGLPGPEVAESRERVRAAILSSGFEFPNRKIVVNLAPASIQKSGTGADLAIALSILGKERLGLKSTDPLFAWGELGLGGEIKKTGRMARALSAALKANARELWISKADLPALTRAKGMIPDSSGLQVVALTRLEECVNANRIPLETLKLEPELHDSNPCPPELAIDPNLARTLELSVTGFHHLLLLGPKGVGKSQALDWVEYLMQSLSDPFSLERTHLAELSEKGAAQSLVRRVGVHVKPAALIGSFQNDRLTPGEFSLAHGGCLLADEYPEWPRDSREALREPLERGSIHLTRVHASIDFPARFLFIANGNLCPCGGVYGRKRFEWATRCRCKLRERLQYFSKVRGPVLDRIDLVRIYDSPSLNSPLSPDPQTWVKRISESRHEMTARFGKLTGSLSGAECEEILERSPDWKRLLGSESYTSLRERHKVFRVALTRMILDRAQDLNAEHIREALEHRRLPEMLSDSDG